MKNKKKAPKVRLPKYAPGGTMYYDETLGVDPATGNATTGSINDKRSKGITANQANQYAQAGTAIMGGGMQAFNAYSDPNANSLEKTRGLQAGIDNAEVGVAGAINPALGMVVGGAKKLGSGVQTRVDRTDENGNLVNRGDSKFGEVVGGFSDPANSLIGIYSDPKATTGQKIAGALTGGLSDMFTNRHRNQVESSAKENLANQPMYPNGGRNPYANAEIESQENVVAPNGSFLQADGPTHQDGGVPVNIPGNSMIFSDRLKPAGSKKTFANLNEVNNTKKEDKILTSNKFGDLSKRTAEIMKFVKNKNSEDLFNNQESLKQEKVLNYAKKMGVTLPGSNPEQFPNGGLKKYPDGGIGNKVTTVPSNYKFDRKVDNKQVFVDPGNINQAQSGTQKADPNQYNAFLINKMKAGLSPDELVKQGYATEQGIAPLRANYQPKYVHIEPFDGGDKSQEVPNNFQPYASTRSGETLLPKQTATQDWNTYSFADLNGQTNKSTQRHFDNSGNEFSFDSSYKRVPTGKNLQYYRDTNVRSDGQGSTLVPNSNINVLPTITHKPEKFNSPGSTTGGGFAYGGKMLPKYPNGNESDFIEPKKIYNPYSDNLMNAPVYNPELYGTGHYDPNDLELKGNPQIVDIPTNTPPVKKGSNIDWANIATTGINQLAQNAGNIYNLSRYNKPEVETYERAKASYLDPSAAIRDANDEARRAEYNVRGASAGNAGTYLSNRVGLNTANIINKDRIRQQYANTNAGIANQNSQFNSQIAMQEVIANAQNRARNRSGKGEAIGSIGQNISGGMKDAKGDKMDQATLELMMKYYNTPEFQKIMKENKFRKGNN